MHETRQQMLRRLGRLAVATLFVYGGADAVRDPAGRVGLLEEAGWPSPELMAQANGAVMVSGGFALAFTRVRAPAAAVLLGSLIPTTLVGHPVWRREGAARKAAVSGVFQNVAVAGGLLLAGTAGADQ